MARDRDVVVVERKVLEEILRRLEELERKIGEIKAKLTKNQ